MKTLYFLRHAKSSWKDAELSDIDRPLNKRGKINAPAMGRHMRKLKVSPQLIISSPSKRTLTTAHIVAARIGYEEKNVKIDMHLYGANIAQLMQLIYMLDDNLKKVMLVGHNPSFTLIVDYLTGKPIDNLPTSGLVQIDFDVKKWKEIIPRQGDLKLFEYPKKLTDAEKQKARQKALKEKKKKAQAKVKLVKAEVAPVNAKPTPKKPISVKLSPDKKEKRIKG